MSSNDEDVLSLADSDLEAVEEPPQVTEQNNENQDDETKKEVKIKRVRNPQPKLNAERLKGPRGIHTLEALFKDVKFKGHKHEEEDLNVLMKTYEYWCNRLFPKLPFDDCLERIERLGYKKPVQIHIKKIRMDMLLEDETAVEHDPIEDIVTEDFEEFSAQPNSSIDFDNLLAQPLQSNTVSELTEEQLERIRINKERAQQIRQQRLNLSTQNVDRNVAQCSSFTVANQTDSEIPINDELLRNTVEYVSQSQMNQNEMSLNQEMVDEHENLDTADMNLINND